MRSYGNPRPTKNRWAREYAIPIITIGIPLSLGIASYLVKLLG
jgi:hypothetical protein